MIVSHTLVTAPSVEPVSLASAKTHLRVECNDEDDLIGEYIAAARQWCEDFCERAFITQYRETSYDEFPSDGSPIPLLCPRVATVESVKYDDADDDEQTLSAATYNVSAARDQAWLSLVQGETWPTTGTTPAPVRITTKCGYGPAASDVPPAIKAAVRLMTEHMYRSRGPVVIGTISSELALSVESLLTPYKVMRYA